MYTLVLLLLTCVLLCVPSIQATRFTTPLVTKFSRSNNQECVNVSSLLPYEQRKHVAKLQTDKDMKIGVLLLNLGGPETLDVSWKSVV